MTDFRALHQPGNPFILGNAWDVGSARMLVALGARAIATSSARDLADHLSVPVSADLEDGYGPDPADCAETVELAALAGLAGCCIEDVTPNGAPYDFDLSVARTDAAVKAARRANHDFVFCARADGVMHGTYDLDEAIRRLQAFEAVGADVLYCPMPETIEGLTRLCASVTAPVNALAAGPWTQTSRDELPPSGSPASRSGRPWRAPRIR